MEKVEIVQLVIFRSQIFLKNTTIIIASECHEQRNCDNIIEKICGCQVARIMNLVRNCNILLALLILWTMTRSIRAVYPPKSEVEAVPGLILPIAPNSICMYRSHYECKWTYEKSCSCNPVKPKKQKRRIEVTFIRKRLKIKNIAPIDQGSYECFGDRCI